jgi:hypothetical protein
MNEISKYQRVLISSMWKRDTRIPITTEDEYMNKFLKMNINQGGFCEMVGLNEYQVKPYFDLDFKDINNEGFDDNIIEDIIKDIQKIFKSDIYIAKRDPREVEFKNQGTIIDVMKYSYRLYQQARISYNNIEIVYKDVFDKYDKNNLFDKSVYQRNRVMLVPLSNRKKNDVVPPLKVIKGNLFDCCATYIKEDYEDLDKLFESNINKFSLTEPKISYKKIDDDDDDDDIFNDKDKYNYDFIFKIINKLSSKRADNYDTWLNVCFAIMGACKKSCLGKKSCCDLIHHFSKLSPNIYEEDKVQKFVDDNYEKQLKKEKTYGYRQLIHTYLQNDDPSYYDVTFGKSYQYVKTKLEEVLIKCDNNYCFIQLNLDRDEINDEPFFILTLSQLLHKYNDKFMYKYERKKGCKEKTYETAPIINEWLKDENKKRCLNLCFKPYQLTDDLNQKHFNLFRGFRASKLPICKDYIKIDKILFHIKNVICNGDDYSYNWFLKYMRAVITGKRTDVMIMIKGLEGCGKNMFINMFAYGIVGKEYAVSTSIPEKQFFGQFNSSLQSRCLAVVNEGRNGLRECIDRIKDFITEDTISIEKKGKDPIILDNFTNFIGDTNNWNILKISPTDRRFVWFECNNFYVGNKEYFDLLANACGDDEALSALYHYLIEEVSNEDIDFQKTRPITIIYKKLQRVNLDNPIKFLINLYDNDITYTKYQGHYFKVFKVSDLYEKYKTFCSTNKYEAYQLDQFESKITEKDTNGIKKGLYNRAKVFRFYKNDFEEYIKQFNQLEDLEDMTLQFDKCDFIDD